MISPIAWPGLLAGLLLGFPAQDSLAQIALESVPTTPVRGSLIQLRLTPMIADLVTELRGEVAGEPLHLTTADGMIWTGLAPVPVEGGDSLGLTLVLVHSGMVDTVRTAIGVAQAPYPSEKLSVPPKMAEPDSSARARIARDNARARAVARAAQSSERLWQGAFTLPRASRVTSGFGTARVYNGKVESRHMGTDFAGKTGETVRATNRGRVALVARFYLAGRVVYLDHGEGLISAYFHLSRALVKPGDIVETGQPIGAVGASGRVTGPHLHWVIRYGSVSVDPMSVVALLGDSTGTGEVTGN